MLVLIPHLTETMIFYFNLTFNLQATATRDYFGMSIKLIDLTGQSSMHIKRSMTTPLYANIQKVFYYNSRADFSTTALMMFCFQVASEVS